MRDNRAITDWMAIPDSSLNLNMNENASEAVTVDATVAMTEEKIQKLNDRTLIDLFGLFSEVAQYDGLMEPSDYGLSDSNRKKLRAELLRRLEEAKSLKKPY